MTSRINRISMKRIMKDMKEVKDLEKMGIYVHWEEDNMYKAWAMIVGPEDTPYEKGFLFFEFDFPSRYPFEHPSGRILTTDGQTRLHPNLYTNGKICLSLLGTWAGPSWTSSQNFSSLLIAIQSILNEWPLWNEPGFEDNKSKKSQDYNEMVRHQMYVVSIIQQFKHFPASCITFRDKMIEIFKKNIHWYIPKLIDYSSKFKDIQLDMKIYSRKTIYLNYSRILNEVITIYNGLCENVDEMILMDFNSKNEIVEDSAGDVVPPEPPVLV